MEGGILGREISYAKRDTVLDDCADCKQLPPAGLGRKGNLFRWGPTTRREWPDGLQDTLPLFRSVNPNLKASIRCNRGVSLFTLRGSLGQAS